VHGSVCVVLSNLKVLKTLAAGGHERDGHKLELPVGVPLRRQKGARGLCCSTLGLVSPLFPTLFRDDIRVSAATTRENVRRLKADEVARGPVEREKGSREEQNEGMWAHRKELEVGERTDDILGCTSHP
jgi:hypothetical protein